MKNLRYIVAGRDMDGISGYYVVDTHSELYKLYGTDICGSGHTYGLSHSKKEMAALADKMNKETA